MAGADTVNERNVFRSDTSERKGSKKRHQGRGQESVEGLVGRVCEQRCTERVRYVGGQGTAFQPEGRVNANAPGVACLTL